MSKKCTITIKDEVFSYVTGLEPADQKYLFEKMERYVEGYRFMPQFVRGVWNGKMPFFHTDGKIYTRLLEHITPFIERWNYDIDLVDKRRLVQIVETRIDKDWFRRKEGMPFDVELRPYQVDAINACLENQSGFIIAATGAGKCLAGGTGLHFVWGNTEKDTDYFSLFSMLEHEGHVFDIDIPVDVSQHQIKFPTPTGWEDVVAAVKKTDRKFIVNIWNPDLQESHRVFCAAGHIFIDEEEREVRADALKPDDWIRGEFSDMQILSIVDTGEDDFFYDVSIDAPHHSYYDAYGVLHHNTWMVAGLTDVLANNSIRSLVIVPSDDLVQQTIETLQQGLLDVGTYSGAKKDLNHDVIVATWQALQNNPSVVGSSIIGPGGEYKGQGEYCGIAGTNPFGAIIVDEAHGAKAKVVGELINVAGGQVPYRFGFTGTMPKPEIDQLTLQGSIGDVLFSITAAELMAMGYLAELEIEPIEIHENVEEEFPDYASEKSFLTKCKGRLEFLADLIIAKTAQYGNTLVLVNSVAQGKALQKLIKDSVFLHGADDTATRREWYDLFESRNDLIVIATFGIASTGLSIDRIYHLCLIDTGRSFCRTLQALGRGLRKGKGKTKVHVSEVYSDLKWSKKHFRERTKFYKEAKYNVLKPVKYKL